MRHGRYKKRQEAKLTFGALNLLVGDVWVHISATFLPDLDSARRLVEVAQEVIRRA